MVAVCSVHIELETGTPIDSLVAVYRSWRVAYPSLCIIWRDRERNGLGYIDDAGDHSCHEGEGDNWVEEPVRECVHAEPMPELQPPLGDPVSEDFACDRTLSDEEFLCVLKGLGMEDDGPRGELRPANAADVTEAES